MLALIAADMKRGFRSAAILVCVASCLLLVNDAAAGRILSRSSSRTLQQASGLSAGVCRNVSQLIEGAAPVKTQQRPRVLTAKFPGFVDRRKDSYYWLNNRSDLAVIAHLVAENNATKFEMKPTEALQATLYDEIISRSTPQGEDPPIRANDAYWYYTFTNNSSQYDIFARRRLTDSQAQPTIDDEMDLSQPEQIILDPNAVAKASGATFFSITEVSVSRDGQWLAYSVDTTGSGVNRLYVKKLVPPGATPSVIHLLGPIQGVSSGNIVWAADNTTFFCTTVEPQSSRSNLVKRFRATARGLSPGVVVHNETDPSFNIDLSLSRDGSTMFMYLASDATTNMMLLNASDPTGTWLSMGPRVTGRRLATADIRGEQVLILESDNTYLNGRLLVAPIQQPANTVVLIEHSVEVKLDDFAVSAGHLLVMSRENGVVTPEVFTLGSLVQEIKMLGKAQALELPEEAYTVALGYQGPFNSTVARMSYSSFSSPQSTLDFDLVTGENAVKYLLKIANYDESNYRTERLWVLSGGDVKVPVDIVYREELLRKGSGGNPLLLEAYGAYGVPVDPDFQPERLSLLDRGFVFALAHPRGGGELGEYWHRAGMLLQKRNTFIDVIATIEYLIKEGYTSSDQLALRGASAGGMTAGAVMNMRPDLLQAVLLEVPFVDVLTTERDVTLPLTVMEWSEWGDPLHNKTAYSYIKTYSPQDNIVPQAYPDVFIFGGLSDSRVGYWEPAKFAAKLRSTATSHNLVLLQVNLDGGHLGAPGRLDQISDVALKYSFIMTALSSCRITSSPSKPSVGKPTMAS